MLTIVFEPVLPGWPCKHCGVRVSDLSRTVYLEGNMFAAYFARFNSNHTKDCVSTLISTGNWSKAALPAERRSFFMRIWSTIENYQVDLGNAEDSPWGVVEQMGRTLDRGEAMVHPSISDIFHITDKILSEDIPIIEYLAENQSL